MPEVIETTPINIVADSRNRNILRLPTKSKQLWIPTLKSFIPIDNNSRKSLIINTLLVLELYSHSLLTALQIGYNLLALQALKAKCKNRVLRRVLNMEHSTIIEWGNLYRRMEC